MEGVRAVVESLGQRGGVVLSAVWSEGLQSNWDAGMYVHIRGYLMRVPLSGLVLWLQHGGL